jgi:micrococcal nuclease
MYEYYGNVVKVVDGDTYDIKIDLGFNITIKQRFRLLGVDCQETKLIRGTTEEQKGAGLSAKEFVKTLFADNSYVKIVSHKTDKYGRYLAEVYKQDSNNEWSIHVNHLLIENGFNK